MRLLMICLAAIAAVSATGTAAYAQTTAFTNVTVVTMTDQQVLENQTVVVSDGIVVSIGTAAEIPADAVVVAGEGGYLVPGLADMHVHLGSSDEYINYLAHGVTTVMSLGSPKDRALRIRDDRDAIRRGDLLGPNIITTGRILDGDPPTGGGSTLWSLATPDAARAAVAELDAAGFDLVKTYNNISREAFEAIVEEAASRGLPVVGHIPRNFDPLTSIGSGLDVVAHSEEFFFTVFAGPRSTSDIDRAYRPDLALLPALVGHLADAGVHVIPNLSYSYTIQTMWDDLENVWSNPEMRFLSPSTASEWRRGNLRRRDHVENFVFRDGLKYSLMQEITRKLADEGVPLLLGTDAPLEGLFPGKSAHRELRELVKAGLTGRQALAIATRHAGDFAATHLRDSERFGRIEPGYRADLLLLRENPLTDVRNVEAIAGVMVRGRWLDRAELEARRQDLALRYASVAEIRGTLAEAARAGVLHEKASDMVRESGDFAEAIVEIERSINAIGYDYVGSEQLSRALEVFKVNTELFPASANTWDSLAETHLALGDRAKSIELYRKALEVDPAFGNARAQLDRILADD